jgi:hypothetical protein
MKEFLIGVVVGIVIATVGLTGVSRIFDRGVDTIKSHSIELSK